MKGIILMFLCLSGFGIFWGYCSEESKSTIKETVRKNLMAILLSIVVITLAVIFSLNSTLRLI